LEFLKREFLAPALRGGVVQVRIAGVVCRLKVEPADFQGWGVFQPRSHTAAQVVRTARLAERQRYLQLFPLVRLILFDKRHDLWLALPAHRADTRFKIDGMVPVEFVEDAQPFEVIESRFDGVHFWYAGPDARWDPGHGVYLRQALEKMVPPDELQRPGLTAEERAVYAAHHWLRYQASAEARRQRAEDRVREALAHGGAELQNLLERGDVYTVTFEIDGRRHTSVVDKNNLGVQVAGICLSGQDEDFDLTSLVGVLREAGGGVVRVGHENQGMAEEQYWQVHPPRRE
jgi:hypothetical protein